MFRTILVPASGSDTDVVVFATALTAARPYRAHLEFFHVCVSAGEALRYTPHASFARGEALHNVLQEFKQESEHRSEAAQGHVRDFCKRNKIAMLDRPGRCQDLGRMLALAGIAAFSADAEMIRRRPIQQYHCSLCAGLFPQGERLWVQFAPRSAPRCERGSSL
jgi:hypothetical protein